MKKVLLIAVLLLAGQWAEAQNAKFGIKLGVGTTTASLKNSLSISTTGNGGATQTFTFTEGNSALNFHAGFAGRISLSKLYVQPELYFSSVSNEISYLELGNTNVKTVAETMTRLDIPVLVGVKLAKVFRVQAGPVASLALSQESGIAGQLAQVLGEAVEKDGGNFAFGLQAGVGVDMGSRLSIDVKYETNLSWFGSQLEVDDKTYNLDLRSRQVLLSLGLWF